MCSVRAVMVVGFSCLPLELFTCGCGECDTGQTTTPPAQPEPEPEIDVSPLLLDFEGVAAGESKALKVTIANQGKATLTVSELTISPSGTFSQSQTTPLTVEPGTSKEVEVTYEPDRE